MSLERLNEINEALELNHRRAPMGPKFINLVQEAVHLGEQAFLESKIIVRTMTTEIERLKYSSGVDGAPSSEMILNVEGLDHSLAHRLDVLMDLLNSTEKIKAAAKYAQKQLRKK